MEQSPCIARHVIGQPLEVLANAQHRIGVRLDERHKRGPTRKRFEAKRSAAANRYLFGVIYRDIEEYTGQPKEQIHDEMCVRFTSETISYVNPKTGEMVWEHKTQTKPWSGVLTTGSKVLFGATGGWLNRSAREDGEAYFFALDAESGKELWRINLGGTMASNPMTYMVNGKQMVTMAAGSAVFTFALP